MKPPSPSRKGSGIPSFICVPSFFMGSESLRSDGLDLRSQKRTSYSSRRRNARNLTDEDDDVLMLGDTSHHLFQYNLGHPKRLSSSSENNNTNSTAPFSERWFSCSCSFSDPDKNSSPHDHVHSHDHHHHHHHAPVLPRRLPDAIVPLNRDSVTMTIKGEATVQNNNPPLRGPLLAAAAASAQQQHRRQRHLDKMEPV